MVAAVIVAAVLLAVVLVVAIWLRHRGGWSVTFIVERHDTPDDRGDDSGVTH